MAKGKDKPVKGKSKTDQADKPKPVKEKQSKTKQDDKPVKDTSKTKKDKPVKGKSETEVKDKPVKEKQSKTKQDDKPVKDKSKTKKDKQGNETEDEDKAVKEKTSKTKQDDKPEKGKSKTKQDDKLDKDKSKTKQDKKKEKRKSDEPADAAEGDESGNRASFSSKDGARTSKTITSAEWNSETVRDANLIMDGFSCCIVLVMEDSPDQSRLAELLLRAVETGIRRKFSCISGAQTAEKVKRFLASHGQEDESFMERQDLFAEAIKSTLIGIKETLAAENEADQQIKEKELTGVRSKDLICYVPPLASIGVSGSGFSATSLNMPLKIGVKTRMRKRGEVPMPEFEVIDDAPRKGPQRYVLLQGFYNPHVIDELRKIGVKVDGILSMAYPKVNRHKVSNTEVEDGTDTTTNTVGTLPQNLKMESLSENPETRNSEVNLFWTRLSEMYHSASTDSPFHDIGLMYLPLPDTKTFDLETPDGMTYYVFKIYDEIAKRVYEMLVLEDWFDKFNSRLQPVEPPLQRSSYEQIIGVINRHARIASPNDLRWFGCILSTAHAKRPKFVPEPKDEFKEKKSSMSEEMEMDETDSPEKVKRGSGLGSMEEGDLQSPNPRARAPSAKSGDFVPPGDDMVIMSPRGSVQEGYSGDGEEEEATSGEEGHGDRRESAGKARSGINVADDKKKKKDKKEKEPKEGGKKAKGPSGDGEEEAVTSGEEEHSERRESAPKARSGINVADDKKNKKKDKKEKEPKDDGKKVKGHSDGEEEAVTSGEEEQGDRRDSAAKARSGIIVEDDKKKTKKDKKEKEPKEDGKKEKEPKDDGKKEKEPKDDGKKEKEPKDDGKKEKVAKDDGKKEKEPKDDGKKEKEPKDDGKKEKEPKEDVEKEKVYFGEVEEDKATLGDEEHGDRRESAVAAPSGINVADDKKKKKDKKEKAPKEDGGKAKGKKIKEQTGTEQAAN